MPEIRLNVTENDLHDMTNDELMAVARLCHGLIGHEVQAAYDDPVGWRDTGRVKNAIGIAKRYTEILEEMEMRMEADGY